MVFEILLALITLIVGVGVFFIGYRMGHRVQMNKEMKSLIENFAQNLENHYQTALKCYSYPSEDLATRQQKGLEQKQFSNISTNGSAF